MAKAVLIVLLAGMIMGLAIGLAHTDNPTIVAPPVAPVTVVPYGDR